MNQSQSEQVIVASCLCNHEGESMQKPGPNVCTVLAHWPWFESVEARIVAEAIIKCKSKGWWLTRKNVALKLSLENKPWLMHPTFSDKNALPLSVAESEAYALLPHYRNKRITQVIATAYEACMKKPECARTIAIDLRLQLEDFA